MKVFTSPLSSVPVPAALLRAALLPSLLFPIAHAQNRAGSVILSPVLAQVTLTPVDAGASRDIPTGWHELRGQLRTATNTRQSFPDGTQATVTLRDTTAPDRTLVTVRFPVSRLPAPYQIVFNPVRLQGGHTYTVQATLTSPTGQTLWKSAAAPLPATPRAVLNLR
ncbi:YbaY family lipoprotein [Deinococcus sp.]|uniref:YbaY family lipoprotein n=1 Tax=Deinococcus sp. TaxID=47478 RepID=UPI0025BA9DA3|nr:YbaY family lipoprotein [Deinococcus sp.]